MELNYQPREVEIRNSDQELYIQWADGHESLYSLFGLRKNCPCVECRGGHSKMGSFDKSLFHVDAPQRFEAEDVKQVGNHAIRIYWSDGHSNGMYQWETLRKLCPCSACMEHDFFNEDQ